jgi:hypothetical protein
MSGTWENKDWKAIHEVVSDEVAEYPPGTIDLLNPAQMRTMAFLREYWAVRQYDVRHCFWVNALEKGENGAVVVTFTAGETTARAFEHRMEIDLLGRFRPAPRHIPRRYRGPEHKKIGMRKWIYVSELTDAEGWIRPDEMVERDRVMGAGYRVERLHNR